MTHFSINDKGKKMAKHKHADVIHAWADGATIQCKFASSDWQDISGTPGWGEHNEYRIKPERVYPETLMTKAELDEAQGFPIFQSRNIANAALRHAIDAGQVALISELVKATRTLELAGYIDCGGELWKPPLGKSPDERSARDMAIAVAVRNACERVVGANSYNSQYSQMGGYNTLAAICLENIIATVK